MKKFFMAVSLLALMIFAGCGENSRATSAEMKEPAPMKTIVIHVNGQKFSATLEDNPTARAFAEKLPLEVDMTELNGNEKYFYLAADLPSDSARVKQICSGELMLFGSNCVVLFYKDFPTSYSYTRLGKLDNPANLEKILGGGNVRVRFVKPTS